MISFDNGIFHTVPYKTGQVYIVDGKTKEEICLVKNQAELDWSINKLMLRREAETNGRIWV